MISDIHYRDMGHMGKVTIVCLYVRCWFIYDKVRFELESIYGETKSNDSWTLEYQFSEGEAVPEASLTMRALEPALVSAIITLLNDSERSLNKKWLRPVTNKSNPPIGWKLKQN